MTLNKEQIGQLFEFTRKKYVEFYDVQVELVDHLASGIEELMSQDPQITFDTALRKVYGNFGIFGFSDFVASKEKQVEKKFRRLQWQEFFAFFTIPKIAMTLTVFLFVCFLQNLIGFFYTKLSLGLVVSANIIFLFIRFKDLWKKKSKKLVSDSFYSPWYSLNGIFIQCLTFPWFSELPERYFLVLPILAVLITACNLAYSTALNKVRSEQMRLYPEAFAKT